MPRVVIHALITVNAAYVEEFKTLFKEVTRASLAEPGCEYYVGV
jgi:quinol monooxygenase YgiN